LKEQISKQSEELTVLRGTKDVVVRISNELVRMKRRAQEAEGELTIIKGIGNSSPEMKELEDSLAVALEVNESHQKLNGKLQARLTEVEEDNKKLSKQIDDYLNKFRNAGL